MSTEIKHWAESLVAGDNCSVIIRHETDGSKNIWNANIKVVDNNKSGKVILALYNGKHQIIIPYNDIYEGSWEQPIIPRRLRFDLNEPAELAIYNAMQEVEKMGADEQLTGAVILLSKAKELVADFIDGIARPDPTTHQLSE